MIEPREAGAAPRVFADEAEKLMPDLEALLVYVRRAIATAVTRAAAVAGPTVRLRVPPAHRGFRGHGRLHAAVPTVARGGTRQTGRVRSRECGHGCHGWR